jgi:RND family efflux transporter MFP subunit
MDQADLLHQLRIDRSEPAARTRGAGTWIAIAAAIVLVLALAAAGWWWFAHGKAVEVQVATAAAPAGGTAAAAVLQATGYVTARRQATVSAQITGTLVDVLIEEGEHVEAGQVLAHLEDTAQRANLALAEAQLASAQALVKQYEAQSGQARRDLARSEDLAARNLVSAQAVETARTQLQSLAAQMTAQQRQVDLARAQVQGARVQLDYTIVRAPFAGVVIAKAAQPGEIVSPLSAGGGFTRTGVGTIVDMDSLEIEVDVNESYIKRVAANQPVEAVLDAYPDWTIPGHVIAIIPTADRSKATVKVRVALDQKDARIVPDMGVRVSFLEEARATADGAPPPQRGVLVPAASIVQRGGKAVVFAVEDGLARERAVVAGDVAGDLRLVEGIGAGTRVVRDPPKDLADGARVRVASR